MYLLLLLLLLTTAGSSYSLFKDTFEDQLVTYLHADKPHLQHGLTLLQTLYSQNRIHIFCRRDQPLRLNNIFQNNRLQLITKAPAGDYRQYRAATAEAVYEAHLQRHECHEGKLLAGRAQEVHYIRLPAHGHSCYGIYTNQAYTLTLLQSPCDWERLARFVLGLVLWFVERWSQLGQTLICCYSVAIVLGVHLAILVVVCIALISRGDHHLKYLRPVADNFKLVLDQYPSTVALALFTGAWMVLSTCHRHRALWQYPVVRRVHCRVLRLLAYMLILGSSSHPRFGWICVCLLLSWPQLCWLRRWLWLQLIKSQRNLLPPPPRRLLSVQEFQAQAGYETQLALGNMRRRLRQQTPTWEQMAQLIMPQQFAQFLSSGTHDPEEMTRNSRSSLVNCPRQHVQQSNCEDNADRAILEHLEAIMSSDFLSSIGSSSPTESLDRILHFTDPTRCLQHDLHQH